MEKVDLNKLKTFYYVALEGSYQKASIHLGIKSSYISKHITALEEHFKITLFKRFHRSLILTEQGKAFMKSVQILMEEIEKLEELSHPEVDGGDDTIRIVTTTGLSILWLIRQLKEFPEHYPQYKFRIFTTETKIDLTDRFIDVFILPNFEPNPDFIRKTLFTFQTHLYASKEYLEKFGTPKTLEDLDKHRLISFYHNEAGHKGNVDWHLSRGTKDRRRAPFLVINSAIGQFEAAIQGQGIAALSDILYIRDSNLVKVLPGESMELSVYYAIPAPKRQVAKIQALQQFFERRSL